jgi:hypothetical protein
LKKTKELFVLFCFSETGFTVVTRKSAFLVALQRYVSLSIVFSTGGKSGAVTAMVKSAFQALLLDPARLRLALQSGTAESQASKSDDQSAAVESTPQTRSSKSAVQPEASKTAATTKPAVQSGVTKSSVQQSAVQSGVTKSSVQQPSVQPVGFCSRCTRQFAGKYIFF